MDKLIVNGREYVLIKLLGKGKGGCVKEMVSIGEEYGARWLCAGKCSVKGHPHHPLYLRKDEITRDFDVLSYLEGIK